MWLESSTNGISVFSSSLGIKKKEKSVLSLDWVCTSVLGMVETGERMPDGRCFTTVYAHSEVTKRALFYDGVCSSSGDQCALIYDGIYICSS